MRCAMVRSLLFFPGRFSPDRLLWLYLVFASVSRTVSEKLAEGTADDVLRDPRVIEAYIGRQRAS